MEDFLRMGSRASLKLTILLYSILQSPLFEPGKVTIPSMTIITCNHHTIRPNLGLSDLYVQFCILFLLRCAEFLANKQSNLLSHLGGLGIADEKSDLWALHCTVGFLPNPKCSCNHEWSWGSWNLKNQKNQSKDWRKEHQKETSWVTLVI